VHFSELQAAARLQLGELYCERDYPASLEGLFAVTWDYRLHTAITEMFQRSVQFYVTIGELSVIHV
jgi:hypothetical protein